MKPIQPLGVKTAWLPVLGMIFIITTGNVLAKVEDEETILQAVKARSTAQVEQIKTMHYRAETKTTISNAQNEVERVIASSRLITYAPPKEIQNDFLGMTINGRALSRAEMEAELKKSRGKARQSPFHPDQMANYHFTLAGEETYEGQKVWKVRFDPVELREGLAKGYAYVVQSTLDVVYLTFVPAKLPGVMKKMEAQITYQPVEGFWVPKTFAMDMHVKVAFILTLADQFIHIQENYSNYSFNMPDTASPNDR